MRPPIPRVRTVRRNANCNLTMRYTLISEAISGKGRSDGRGRGGVYYETGGHSASFEQKERL